MVFFFGALLLTFLVVSLPWTFFVFVGSVLCAFFATFRRFFCPRRFVGANPRHGVMPMLESSFLYVEKEEEEEDGGGSSWNVVYTDADWETK